MIVKEYHHGITPFAFVVIIGWIVFGALLMISGIFFGKAWEVTPAIESMPEVIESLCGMFLVSGGTGMLLASRGKATIRQALKLEYTGLILAAAGWLTYSFDALFAAPRDVGPWVLGLTFAAAALARVYGTYEYEKKMRKMTWSREL